MKSLVLLIFLTLLSFNLFAGEESTYSFSWLDKDKKVYVLQNRKYRKSGKLIFNVGTGFTTSGSFTKGQAFQGKIDYFIHEEFGFELLYSKNDGEENTTAETLRNGTPGARPFRRITEEYFGAMLVWSPFYSKINTFNKIIYLDWLFAVGYGKIDETNNKNEVIVGADREDVTETHSGIMWSAGALFYLNQLFSVRFDVNGFHYEADRIFANTNESDEKIWNTHIDMVLNLGIRF